jgi:hypothetical protein
VEGRRDGEGEGVQLGTPRWVPVNSRHWSLRLDGSGLALGLYAALVFTSNFAMYGQLPLNTLLLISTNQVTLRNFHANQRV